MNSQSCVLWQKRRTVGWLNLSLAARGAAEGIVVALDERGELRLGRYGLPGVAGLLGRPWAECEPAVLELLDAGRFVIDEARGVLLDPQHNERRGIVPAPVVVEPRDVRPLSSTERARRTRARRAADAARQLEFPPHAAMQRGAAPRSAAPLHHDDAPPESGVVVRGSERTSERCITAALDSPSLSDLKISSKKERGAATSRDVVQRDATLPDDCRGAFDEACARKDAVLAVDFVWRKFAKHAAIKRWRVHEQLERWIDWVDREIAWTSKAEEHRQPKTNPGAIARARERDAALAAERDQAIRDFERNRPEVLAAAARAMAVFA